MTGTKAVRRTRSDAERSTARILEAAEVVLAADETASLERIADHAQLSRATVHRRFTSRAALLDALAEQLSERYRRGLAEARVDSAPPLFALRRVTEIVFELKLSHRFAIRLTAALTPEVLDGLDRLFVRLRESGAVTAADPVWSRRVYLALLDEVNALSADSPELPPRSGPDEDPTPAKIDLLIRTVLRALGGDGAEH